MEYFIEESKRIIRKARENNKLVVFVGAGVSSNSGCPSWKDLIEKFAKGLGKSIDNISSDDYLKIPQYYYNSRKEKEYYDVISDSFNMKMKPNLIHDLIFELNPYHVITTNYDSLLEEAARNKGMFYDVVSKDSDLPYTPNNNMIIKMHGDLKSQNIVLKEDDYLSYFENFKLIQNYIKSLISTHTLLFVGYSVSDVNVKYIFQWVKDILGNNFQQAYFLEADENKQFDQIEFEYYKNRGINILYYSQAKDIAFFKSEIACQELSHERGQNLYKLLKYVLDEGGKDKLDMDYIYERLKNLDSLNRIRDKDIIKALDLEVPFHEENYIVYSHFDFSDNEVMINSKAAGSLFMEIKEHEVAGDISKKKKVDLIKRVFHKAGIEKIVEHDEQHNKRVILEIGMVGEEDCFEDYIIESDYCSLNDYLNNMDLEDIDGNENDYMDKAYGLYKLGQYLEAYKLLKKVSESCFINRKYFLFFISEFNRYYLGKAISGANFLTAASYGVSMEQQNLIRNEIKQIELENIYLRLPSNNRSSLAFLRDILSFGFVYSKIKETLDLKEKIEKNKYTTYIGMAMNDAPIFKFNRNIRQFWSFISTNRLMLDNYSELNQVFYSYIESALLSHNIEELEAIEDDMFLGFSGKMVRMQKIDSFTLFLMVNYLAEKDIKYLFEKHDIDRLELEEAALILLEEIHGNMISSILNNINTMGTKVLLCKLLYIASRVNLGGHLFTKIVEGSLLVIDKCKAADLRNILESLRILIIRQHNSFNEAIDSERMEKVINSMINMLNPNFKGDILKLINTCINVIKTKDKEYRLKNDRLISLLIREMELEFDFTCMMELLIPVKTLVSSEMNESIKQLIEKQLFEAKAFSYRDAKLYYESIQGKIISTNADLESRFLELAENSLKGDRIVHSFLDTASELLIMLANMKLNNVLLNEQRLNQFKGKYDKLDFLLDIDNFNYDNFKLQWIDGFSDALHQSISEHPKAKEAIKNKLRKAIIEDACGKKTRELFFKYYDI